MSGRSTASSPELQALHQQLATLSQRDAFRASMLRRYGFGDLADAYEDGAGPRQVLLAAVQERLGDEAPSVPKPATTALPQERRMRALTRLVRRDLADNRRAQRTLGRLEDVGDLTTAAALAADSVAQQSESLSSRLRALLTSWSSGRG
jgi:hypothetical protein